MKVWQYWLCVLVVGYSALEPIYTMLHCIETGQEGSECR